jgi:hypothetical protein
MVGKVYGLLDLQYSIAQGLGACMQSNGEDFESVFE